MKILGQSLILITIFAFGCKSSSNTASAPKKEEKIILEIGKERVSSSEFDYIYNKNNNKTESAYSENSIREYLDLFIKFKLKVLEAENQHLDTATSFIQELNGYKKQLAKPYLSEKGYIEKLTKEAYERYKQEVSTSHILIKVAAEADPSDTSAAYNKIADIRKQIAEGADFGEMALTHSEDPSAKMENSPVGYKGNLGYFTALSLVYEYENAMYNTPVGQVSPIFRTQFGYHILKVNDKRNSRGEALASHIMIRAADGMEESDSLEAKRKIDEIHEKLTAGSDWNEMCSNFSDDNRTKQQGGKMRPFRLDGQMGMPAFEHAAFNLKPEQFSKPVKTPYGWHIVKLHEIKMLDPYEEMKDALQKKVSKKPRAQQSQKALIARLKKENNFKEFPQAKEQALSKADSSLTEGKWEYDAADQSLSTTLFSVKENNYSIREFYEYLKVYGRKKPGLSPKYAMELHYKKFVDKTVVEYEENHLESKYYDYKMLVKEYRDGILLFQLMDENVWSKAVKDTAGLRAFYEAHKSDYQWKKRAEANVYNAASKEQIELLKKDLKAGKTHDELLKTYNEKSALALKIDEGTFETGKNDVVDKIDWTKGSGEVEKDNRFYYVVIKKVIPAGQKELKEARGLIISDYQNHLEEEWLKELKTKYPAKVNDEVVKGLIRS